ncbi:DUF1295 domain-containing protein [Spirochaeta lutea]|uniref:Uncharacterized protein n=1 Tax=Spirochaeta lutea TaxID=1480694 RepID=A0A098QVM1_9SPIO|nr:DUF1295 domain-containing protein [Spirochaeta lutea]KGE71865.1 hypothetical protein DC28_08555 [Spirochaeta lutea]
MNLLQLLAWGSAGITLLMLLGFVVASLIRNNGIVDILWGPAQLAFLAAGLGASHGIYGDPLPLHPGLIMLGCWAVRLAVHIGIRNWGKPEDRRYAGFRRRWGSRQLLGALFQVFLLQALLAAGLASATAVLLTTSQGTPWMPGMILGAIIWAAGFLMEWAADAQLQGFKSRGGAGFCREGLWAWSRHPNYFGEVLLWWGYGIFVLAHSGSFIALVSPLIITWLILGVSGVPMLERSMKARDGFEEYARRTSKFIPWPPKGPDRT